MVPAPQNDGRLTFSELLLIQWQVIQALMLRDIKTRFFGSAWGYLVSIAWPVAHILIIVLINSIAGRLVPYGDSAVLWFTTGMIPFVVFNYMSRFIMMGIAMNKPLLVFPRVKIMDILIARAIVELLSAGVVILVMVVILLFMDVDFTPARVTDACYALGAAFLLGLGTGVISAIIMLAWPVWGIIFNLSMILLWLISGVLFVPDALPEQARYYIGLNPIVHIVSWFRSAYYDGYGVLTLDKNYAIGFSLVCLASGLVLERLVRGRLLQG